MRGLGLYNNFWVYIFPGVIGVFNLIIIRSFIYGLPDSILESARIDGAGEYRTFFNIVLPLCICVYPFLQKYFVKGMMVGGVKG